MPGFQVLPAALLALVALSAATPTYTREQRDAMVNLLDLDKRSTFTITQVANSKGTAKRRAAVDILRTQKKYGSTTISNKVVSAASAAESGTVTATPEEYDVEYLCPVTVGDQVLELDFDTGSADLWVFSSLLPSSEQSGHTVYDVSHGTQESGESWSITYADESGASGEVYADTVVVGGVTATSQAVEAATSISSSFQEDTDSDGLLGLAFSSINTVSPTAATTFFDNVKANLASPLFTADLKKGAAGTYDFGFIDTSKYTGDITYTDVDDSEGYWGFTAGGYAVGSSTTTSGSIGSSIMDTGTTLLYLPDTAVEAYYADVSGAQDSEEYGGYVFDCSATLPDFTVEIGGTAFTVDGTYINYESIDSSTCYGGIQSNSGTDFAIFGDVFIKSKFVVFDSSGPQLGVAAQAS